jgi:L-asparaginase/beta-aspartyl-peptidase (threonine type)
MDTPHIMLAGDGADRFARRRGFARHPGPTAAALAHADKLRQWFQKREGVPARWRDQDLRRIWNFPARLASLYPGGGGFACDTIGACAVDARGGVAVANSTGGASPMLLGRVGDSPLPGAGYWAGPAGAVAATGIGEEIARRLLCRTVYEWIEGGTPVKEACDRGIAMFEAGVSVGLIALARDGWASAATNPMAVAYLEEAPR